MLTARRTTPRRVALPSALTALETTVALALAHAAAGGEVPDVAWLGAFGVLAYGASVVVLRRRISIRAAVPVLLAAQVLGHAWLVALSPGADAHAHHDAGPVLGLSLSMVAAHLVAALVAGAAWALRRRAVTLVLHWADPARPGVPALRNQLAATRLNRPPHQNPFDTAPTRGPPASLVPC